MTDEYNCEWDLWDTEAPQIVSMCNTRSELPQRIAAYNKFRCVGSDRLYTCFVRGEIHLWHFRRYPLRDAFEEKSAD